MCNLVATFALQSYGFLSEKQKKKCEKYTIQHYLGPLNHIVSYRRSVAVGEQWSYSHQKFWPELNRFWPESD